MAALQLEIKNYDKIDEKTEKKQITLRIPDRLVERLNHIKQFNAISLNSLLLKACWRIITSHQK